jgi:hypothetical protein
MKTFKQIQTQLKEQNVFRMFGSYIPNEKNSIDYALLDIPDEELLLFSAVMELMRGGLEYQKILSKTNRFNEVSPLEESINPKFISKFRAIYRSGKLYTFKNWVNVFGELLDELD